MGSCGRSPDPSHGPRDRASFPDGRVVGRVFNPSKHGRAQMDGLKTRPTREEQPMMMLAPASSPNSPTIV